MQHNYLLFLILYILCPSSEQLTDNEIDHIIEKLDQEDELEYKLSFGVSQKLESQFISGENNGVLKVEISADAPPGHMGMPVKIHHPSEQQVALIDEGYRRNEFNEYISDLIPIRRQLPDYRNQWCKKPDLYGKTLLKSSIIICFHNEAWSVLLRTIHSILDRSPDHLLTEIILVDDFSGLEHLKEKLQKYVSTLYKVKLIRTTKREGLIRARMLGAKEAKGPVLIFLDSHIEATEGWLLPLVDRITKNWTVVVSPIIDRIHDETLEYVLSDIYVNFVGGFRWDLLFQWVPVREEVFHSLTSPSDPVPSPTMAGGLFAIHKKFWEHIGQYDEEYEIWGGENLELSFKTWMCGGSLEIDPCSHVGHIFRRKSPYATVSNMTAIQRNLGRLAAVWMDDYAKYFFMRGGNRNIQYGNVASRIELRKELNCKSFSWYLQNVYPNVFDPSTAIAEGEIRNEAFEDAMCLDSPSHPGFMGNNATLYICHNLGGNQFWVFTQTGELQRDELCLDYSGGAAIVMYVCHKQQGNQRWEYDSENGLIRHFHSNLCLTRNTPDTLSMEPCDSILTQQWKFSNNYNHNENLSQ